MYTALVGTALFGHQVQNNFFALIKKIFLQTLVEIIFRYHKFFFRVLGPPGPPFEQNEFFYIGGVWFENSLKILCVAHF